MSEREIAEALSLLAHDIKNPLAAILTNLGFVHGYVAQLDPDDADASDVREAIVDARLAGEALQRMVSNLEVVARDLGGARPSVPPEAAPLDLAAIADEVAARHGEAASTRRLRIDVRRSDDAWARADRDPALRAADNVLANAVQNAPAGSTIVIETGLHERDVCLTVLDEGLVIPAERRDDATSREGQSRAKAFPDARYGRGLTLYVAAVSARGAGGALLIGERAGRSAISLVLPRFDEDAQR